MATARILREQTVGETRWLALDSGDRPAALYVERSCANPTVLGARLEGRIAIGRFLQRFPAYRLTASPQRGGRARFRGFLHAPFATA